MYRTHIAKIFLSASLFSLVLVPCTYAQTTHKTKLSMGEAKKIALSKESGTIKSQELEHEKGRWIYSFDIQHDQQVHEVNVDANTGEVVEDSVENPASEAKEKANEHKPRM
ncbi:MAG: PepSY domain-containing protein [Acidobacteriaceae bacterium]